MGATSGRRIGEGRLEIGEWRLKWRLINSSTISNFHSPLSNPLPLTRKPCLVLQHRQDIHRQRYRDVKEDTTPYTLGPQGQPSENGTTDDGGCRFRHRFVEESGWKTSENRSWNHTGMTKYFTVIRDAAETVKTTNGVASVLRSSARSR